MSNVIDQFFKNSAQDDKLVISLNEFQGKQYISIRWHFKPEGQEKYVPTKKGVTLSADHLDRLGKAIEKATKLVNGG